jgi:hypothetical protein
VSSDMKTISLRRAADLLQSSGTKSALMQASV